MTLQEAIERLGEEVEWALHKDDTESLQAVRLGIEAMKWIEWRRKYSKLPPILPLPGETKE